MHGVCHTEIPSKSVTESAAFYKAVFGWETTVMGEGEYAVFKMGDGREGGFDPSWEPAAAGVVLYIEVADIPASLALIKTHGGTVIKEKTEVGGPHGYYALFLDPHDNRLGIWAQD